MFPGHNQRWPVSLPGDLRVSLATVPAGFASKSAAGDVDLSMGKVVMRDPEILGGEPVFAGTRVPIRSLFDHLESG